MVLKYLKFWNYIKFQPKMALGVQANGHYLVNKSIKLSESKQYEYFPDEVQKYAEKLGIETYQGLEEQLLADHRQHKIYMENRAKFGLKDGFRPPSSEPREGSSPPAGGSSPRVKITKELKELVQTQESILESVKKHKTLRGGKTKKRTITRSKTCEIPRVYPKAGTDGSH